MTQRNTPCFECRKHRRKCVRDSINDTCSRCRRLERDCITTAITKTNLSYSEKSKYITQQVDHLNSVLIDLETQLDFLHNTNSPNDRSLVQNNTTILRGDWTLAIKNGTLRIETGIKSIADLLLHCPPPIPFPLQQQPRDSGIVVQFNPRESMCIRALTSELLVRCLDLNNSNMSMLSLPTSFLFDVRSVVDQLLHIYFECHNTFHPLVHQPSFMEYYSQLNNPLDSLVCLCICCHVCSSPCKHTLHEFGDLTAIGRYFSGLAKSKLMDQFDIKEKRIENMISINLLGSYLHYSLLNNESKKLSIINYQIAMDLLPWYKRECENGTASIQCALYSRNIPLILGNQKFMRLPAENSRILFQAASLPWRSVPDEPAELIDFVEGHNVLAKLYNHSIMSELKFRTQDVLSGGVCTIPIEMIVHLDEIIREWWNNLPERYRFCDDWSNLDQCRKCIDDMTDGVVLITFIDFLNYMTGIYSQMLKPKSVTDNNVLSIVEKMVLERALYCCQIIMYGFNKANWLDLSSPCRYILAMKWYLVQIADVLIALSSSSNQTIQLEAQSMLKLCINAIESMTFIKQDTANSTKSPLFKKKPISFRELDDINLAAYSNHPQPWYALIYDICRYLISSM